MRIRSTHALERRPVQASSSGDSPIELHIAAAMKRPVEGLLMVARSQQAPTMRASVKIGEEGEIAAFGGRHGGW